MSGAADKIQALERCGHVSLESWVLADDCHDLPDELLPAFESLRLALCEYIASVGDELEQAEKDGAFYESEVRYKTNAVLGTLIQFHQKAALSVHVNRLRGHSKRQQT